MHRGAGHDQRVVPRQVEADVPHLLQVGAGRVGVELLAGEAVVAPVENAVGQRRHRLALEGLGEEPARSGEGVVDHGLRDAVADDRQEADLLAGAAELAGGDAANGGVGVGEAADVDDGDGDGHGADGRPRVFRAGYWRAGAARPPDQVDDEDAAAATTSTRIPTAYRMRMHVAMIPQMRPAWTVLRFV
jgi:hypothetical protein